jgi:hypothetical protein
VPCMTNIRYRDVDYFGTSDLYLILVMHDTWDVDYFGTSDLYLILVMHDTWDVDYFGKY